LAEVAYEFDRWAASFPSRDFYPSDPLIHLNDGRVGVEAVTTGSAAAMADDLRGIGADIIAVGSTCVSAWGPLTEHKRLSSLHDLTFAGPPLGVAVYANSVTGGEAAGDSILPQSSSAPPVSYQFQQTVNAEPHLNPIASIDVVAGKPTKIPISVINTDNQPVNFSIDRIYFGPPDDYSNIDGFEVAVQKIDDTLAMVTVTVPNHDLSDIGIRVS